MRRPVPRLARAEGSLNAPLRARAVESESGAGSMTESGCFFAHTDENALQFTFASNLSVPLTTTGFSNRGLLDDSVGSITECHWLIPTKPTGS